MSEREDSFREKIVIKSQKLPSLYWDVCFFFYSINIRREKSPVSGSYTVLQSTQNYPLSDEGLIWPLLPFANSFLCTCRKSTMMGVARVESQNQPTFYIFKTLLIYKKMNEKRKRRRQERTLVTACKNILLILCRFHVTLALQNSSLSTTALQPRLTGISLLIRGQFILWVFF